MTASVPFKIAFQSLFCVFAAPECGTLLTYGKGGGMRELSNEQWDELLWAALYAWEEHGKGLLMPIGSGISFGHRVTAGVVVDPGDDAILPARGDEIAFWCGFRMSSSRSILFDRVGFPGTCTLGAEGRAERVDVAFTREPLRLRSHTDWRVTWLAEPAVGPLLKALTHGFAPVRLAAWKALFCRKVLTLMGDQNVLTGCVRAAAAALRSASPISHTATRATGEAARLLPAATPSSTGSLFLLDILSAVRTDRFGPAARAIKELAVAIIEEAWVTEGGFVEQAEDVVNAERVRRLLGEDPSKVSYRVLLRAFQFHRDSLVHQRAKQLLDLDDNADMNTSSGGADEAPDHDTQDGRQP